MIYVSSACVRHDKIKDSIEELATHGLRNIELSGGTKYYVGYEDDVIKLKDKYQLNYLLHSYFPPPPDDFVLNMASLDDQLYQETIEHYERAIRLSQKLGLKKYSFHAGFLFDPKIEEMGGRAYAAELYDRQEAMKRFAEGYAHLKKNAADVELYVENNVLAQRNAQTFKGKNPFLMTDVQGIDELKKFVDFKVLLDVAHLKVTCTTLDLDFIQQLDTLMPSCEYLHLSDNDGSEDQSKCFREDSELLDILGTYDVKHKTITAETYGTAEEIKSSTALIGRKLRIDYALEPKS